MERVPAIQPQVALSPFLIDTTTPVSLDGSNNLFLPSRASRKTRNNRIDYNKHRMSRRTVRCHWYGMIRKKRTGTGTYDHYRFRMGNKTLLELGCHKLD